MIWGAMARRRPLVDRVMMCQRDCGWTVCDGRRGHESLDRVLRPVLQPPSGGGKAFMGLSVRQDDSECKGVQARAVGGSGPGPHGTGVFGKDHIPVAVVAIVHAPMPRLVRSRSSGEAVSASREVMIEVVSMEVGDV